MRRNKILLLTLLAAVARLGAMAQSTNADALTANTSPLAIPDGAKLVTGAQPDFREVYQILSTNLEGVSTNELDHAAALGLIQQLSPRASLVPANSEETNVSPLAQARIFDDSFAYFHVASVTSKLPDAFLAAFKQMTETNKSKIKGLVLDLRFADGFDFAAASKVADCFLSSDHPLLNWQTGSAHATLKSDPITIPAAILINAQTTGAAEGLAAVLRDSDVGLSLGSQTAGQANVFKEFSLHDGSKLRVAVAQVGFGSGKTLATGLTPDIAIDTSLDDERAYLQDPYKVLHAPVAKINPNAKPVLEQPRMNEVELIREHNSGEDQNGGDVRSVPEVPLAPPVTDPALARALDLLKGLAVIQPVRPG